jgi:DNA polymerase I
MRIAAIAATEAGIAVCAPVHDAFWIMAPVAEINDAVRTMTAIMVRAGEAVTGGLRIGVTVEALIRSPDRFGSTRGAHDKGHAFWAEIQGLVTDDLLATGT